MGTFFCACGEGRSAGSGVDQGRQQDVPEPVETESVEVGVGEVELEPASEILDPLLQFIPAQGGDGRHELFELSLRAHGFNLVKRGSSSEAIRRALCGVRCTDWYGLRTTHNTGRNPKHPGCTGAIGRARGGLAGKTAAVAAIDGIGLLLGWKSFGLILEV